MNWVLTDSNSITNPSCCHSNWGLVMEFIKVSFRLPSQKFHTYRELPNRQLGLHPGLRFYGTKLLDLTRV